MAATDLRPLLFGGLPNFDSLSASDDSLWPVWRVTRSDECAWWIGALSAAAAFAEEHGLLETYRAKFAAIPVSELRTDKAEAAHRSSVFPVWEIANELIVGRLLNRLLGWKLQVHEPTGRGSRRGDWQFLAPSGREVFVEVKSLAESEHFGTGVANVPSRAPRLRSVLKGAYSQLPDDGRGTLVVVVGRELLRLPFGLMHGDLFQALFGQIQVTFKVMPYDPGSVRVGPSFREMFIHGSKHRRLAWVAGLVVSGMDEPALRLYAIQNPYADHKVQVESSELPSIEKFIVESDGRGELVRGFAPYDIWARVTP